jgi:hypothetical protein
MVAYTILEVHLTSRFGGTLTHAEVYFTDPSTKYDLVQGQTALPGLGVPYPTLAFITHDDAQAAAIAAGNFHVIGHYRIGAVVCQGHSTTPELVYDRSNDDVEGSGDSHTYVWTVDCVGPDICDGRAPVGTPCSAWEPQVQCEAGTACQDGVCTPLGDALARYVRPQSIVVHDVPVEHAGLQGAEWALLLGLGVLGIGMFVLTRQKR